MSDTCDILQKKPEKEIGTVHYMEPRGYLWTKISMKPKQ
jgi:hypothetical protein